MRIKEFPWSPVLAGFSSGVVGFAAAALATGIIHVGPAGACRLGDHATPGADRTVAAAHGQAMMNPCGCCCEGHRAVAAAEPADSTLQLTAIPRPPAESNCEDDNWAGDREGLAQLTPTSGRAATDPDPIEADPVAPLAPDIRPTLIVAAEPAVESIPTLGGLVTPPAADRGWLANLAGPAGNANVAAMGGAAGISPFGAAGSGGSAATRRAAGVDAVGLLASDPIDAAAFGLAALAWGDELARLADATTARPAVVAALPTSGIAPDPLPDLADSAALGTAAGAGPAHATGPATNALIDPVAVTAVPEPASITLSLIGLGLAGGIAWRRRRADG